MKAISAVAVVVLQAGLACLPLFAVENPAAAPKTGSYAAAQNPLAALENEAKQKAAEAALTKVLNDNLPLTLDAKDVYPTMTTLPGGPFSPTPLKLTADELDQPLPPGDYTINTLDFCSEYSVHEPGYGVSYVLGPYEGKAAGAIGALIWRGTVQYHVNPNSLQAVSWTIQSGLSYAQMPKSYQAIVDQVIPDFKTELTGDFVTNLEATYSSLAKTAGLPPLDAVLLKLGKPGQLALAAERQRRILTAQNTNDEIRQQTLFQGQESGLYTPVKAESGPWTERVAGQAYMKLLIAGGNMATNNVMQIRVMPSPTANARIETGGAHLMRVGFGEGQATPAVDNAPITVANLMEGMIGYSQGQGAQALGQVPVVAPGTSAPPPMVRAGNVMSATGNVSVIRVGTTAPVPLKQGDTINEGDTLVTGPDGRTSVVFEDNTQMTLSPGTQIAIDNYVYDPSGAQPDHAQYRFLEGTFLYVSGLISKPPDADVRIHSDVGCLGIRGTELVAKIDPTAKSLTAYLIEGAVSPGASTEAVHTAPPVSGPLEIVISPSGISKLPMTQGEYNTIKAQTTGAVPVS
jgi:hypothetical protein